MQRKFLKNLALLLVLNLLIKPFWIFGIDRTVQNTVGAEEYGFYFAIFNFSFLFYILLDFGITTFNNKNIAQNNQLLRKHLSNIIVLKLVLFIVYLVFTFFAAFVIKYSKEQLCMLAFLGLNQFLIGFIMYLRSNLGGLHLFRTDSFISVLDRSVMIFICALLLWGNIVPNFKIEYFVYAQTISLSLTAFITMIIVFRKAETKFFKLNWSAPFFMMMLRQSFPYAVLVLLMTFYNRIDSVMLERMLGDDGAMVFRYIRFSLSLAGCIATMIAYLFAVLLLPIFARMLKQKESIEELIKLSYTLIITPAIIIAAASFIYAEEFMTLLYPIHTGESLLEFDYRIMHSSQVFKLLMISFCAISTMYIFSTLLTANGNLRYLNYIAFTGMVINISLNFLLIPSYQAFGSAIATLFTQFLIAGVQVFVVYRLFKFRLNYLLILKVVVFIFGVITLGYFSKQLPLSWHLNFLVLVISSFLIALAIRLISIRYLFGIIKYGEKQ
jgi:O-antigen/teichoic acid export membrane protein